MNIGTLKEIKNNENRIGITPKGARELAQEGHTVYVQASAGEGSGFSDEEYTTAGAKVLSTAKEVYDACELIVKVKEPQKEEYPLLREKQIVFTYFHFASSQELTLKMIQRKVTCIAYETVEKNNRTILLDPMSEIAGRMAPIMAAYYLAKPYGGMGKLMAGTEFSTYVKPAKTVILGGGMVGENALKIALGLHSECILFETNEQKIQELQEKYPNAKILSSTNTELFETEIKDCDVLIGAVYVRGARAPKLVSAELVRNMKKGAIIVDVAIDQGGCIETSKATSHAEPVYEMHGVRHYCVANMPGAYPRTSTLALTTTTLPYVKEIAKNGLHALKEDSGFRKGLNIYQGQITNKGVAESLGLKYVDPEKVL